MNANQSSAGERPEWVQELEQAFGGPNQAAFGTAVFSESLSSAESGQDSLEQRARHWYQFFCGNTWERFGPERWLQTWQLVFARPDAPGSIIDELSALEDPPARRSASTMLDGHDDPQKAKAALKQAFDAPTIEALQIYRIGDGDAMSGILIAGRRTAGDSAFVTFLLD
ncbi:hypothetical protein FYK55_25230 [Roseiconus nitratireducens]|uniref:Uncharacterized protein n=1 Tax=Roseiconus nitratireducens TaxID=2605748 RepID=A0A5M6CYY9_9BACT|nr:hypothetical protein [Roseiconus nitratireducens]KAA5539222.1 hypothetical protein FYK55_25230 [Roseiconus nitratireducens]